jgi:hypothetical protein
MKPSPVEIFNNISTRRPSVITGLLMGGSMYHAIYNEDSYLQLGLAWLTPTVYAGYHIFKNGNQIINKYSGFFTK